MEEEFRNSSEELLAFIERSPSCFHAVESMKAELRKAGFEELSEGRAWKLHAGGNYFVTRNGSSLIALRLPEEEWTGFQIMASHSDSPSFRVKEHAEMATEGIYTRLNVEKYGGMLCAPWFDRPLSIAGRAMVRQDDRIVTRLINIDRDLVLIPNLAIHMNREANDGMRYNVQTDLLPLFGDETAKGALARLVAQEAGAKETDILATDLFLYNRMKGSIWGANEEYLSSPRLDDLQCAFASLKGFLRAKRGTSVAVHCVLDNEEIGSETKQGAASTFLRDVLTRLNRSLGRSEERYLMSLASSLMLSADNAHSIHPNRSDRSDPTNRPHMNGGVVMKINTKYSTDAVSAALFRELCACAGVPVQVYMNRSDVVGGSTLANISNTQVALNSVDIGLAQLAMHSPYETAGVRDTEYLIRAAAQFFGSSVEMTGDGTYRLTYGGK